MSPLEATLLTLTGIYLLNQCSILYQVHGVHVLEDIDAPAPPSWPSVSLIIPACNEESTIEEAMETLLAIDYPAIQILAINDRSTDATGEILDRIAGDHTKLEVVHVDALPEGWLGKVHAMHVGTQAATGDFLLYADADVHFGPTAIRKAVAWAERDAVDLVSLLPRLTSPTIAVGALVLGFGGAFFSTFKPRAINSDTPGAYGGIGAFNLVRKSTFEETEGWPWLRMEIADDVGLGLLLHRHGGRGRIGLAYEDLALTWYDIGQPALRHTQPFSQPDRPYGSASILIPCAGARLTLNGEQANGYPQPREWDGLEFSSCALAFAESWTEWP